MRAVLVALRGSVTVRGPGPEPGTGIRPTRNPAFTQVGGRGSERDDGCLSFYLGGSVRNPLSIPFCLCSFLLYSSGMDKTSLPLFNAKHEVVGWALLSPESMFAMAAYRWNMDSGGYAVRAEWIPSLKRARTVKMHRVLLGLEFNDSGVCDHINRDRLDNRLENLRIVTPAVNTQNKAGRPGSTSQYRGVYWNKAAGKWHASTSIGGHSKFLGLFDDEHEAGRIVSEWRALHMEGAVETLEPIPLADPAPSSRVERRLPAGTLWCPRCSWTSLDVKAKCPVHLRASVKRAKQPA